MAGKSYPLWLTINLLCDTILFIMTKIFETIFAIVIVSVLVQSGIFATWANILLVVVLVGGLIALWVKGH